MATIVAGLLLVPLSGFGTAWLFGLVDGAGLAQALRAGWLPAFLALLLGWGWLHFHHYLRPFGDWLARNPAADNAPGHLHRRLARFPREYWAPFLLYALLAPAIYQLSRGVSLAAELPAFLNLLLLQLTIGVLLGLPAYLASLDQLGRLVSRLGLPEIQVSLRSRLMLLVGFVPLLAYSMLLNYHWLHSGSLNPQLLVLWGLLATVTALVTWLSIRSVAQSLHPVEEVLRRSGASTHADLAGLRPQSTDEIGYLTQTLGRVFRRLGDQESHMRAVVDTAAEGIIVVDEQGRIDTFNPAAEQLFGFLASEIRGKPLAWLLPELAGEGQPPPLECSERESTGLHRNGQAITVSVRVSRMDLSGKPMFTCLVADITQRKQAEHQLLNAEARYRDLVETAHDLVWSTDAEGCWTYLNGACQSIYGYSPQEMIGRHISEFRTASHAERDEQAFRAILRGEELVQYETVHKDREGREHHLSFNARAHLDEEGRVQYISGTARDISEQKAFQQQLAYQAEHDSLTGLFNRHYFQQELERTVARVARSATECALFYIDLDQFKYINDTLGHAAGDQLLMEISALLRSHVREGDLLARFGGDEFTLLVYNVDAQQAPRVAENFRRLFEEYVFHYDGKNFNVTCSIGGALIDAMAGSADEMLSHADLACNMAKTQGRNRVHLYNPADSDKAGMAEDMGWAARVREMLEQDRFQLVYQPIVSVDSGVVQDYEVLVRMVCDDGDVILPGGFMPAAERFGLIHSVDRWIVRRAMHQLATLREQGMQVCFSINLSGKAFEDDQLLPMIQQLLRETGLDPSWLTFEITETAAIAYLGAAERFIGELKEIGCQFALDDFGSGFSSFTYLKHLPVDKLKIDGSFVQGMAQSSVDQAMVQSMHQIAHALGKVTIAEYVESAEILALLKEYGIDYAQGNYLGKPRDALLSLTPSPASNVTRLQQ
ncbi:EAL domain-containing protein [Thiohalobacter sp. IOR34]|uniref:putative bifunctional diguanylate cyclase/phosphodiesterase n=1 Tax=Thiohalobacter sp. IOR34 TaxID=3057176 RepID=UPI0025B07785|nr:EAL domain-containing protein [Thiohalobacter sp. IOR34]WJW75478.1 EAL domain-containing protein [Thiohalobacter sp. IOR34]